MNNYEENTLAESAICLVEDIFNLREEKLNFSDSDTDKQKIFRTLLIDRKVNTPRELTKKELKRLFHEYRLILSDPKRTKETLEKAELYRKVAEKEKAQSAKKIQDSVTDYSKDEKNKLDEEVFLNSF